MPDGFRIILSARASDDLQEIFDHISKDSPQNAADMVAKILDAIELLKTFPRRTVVPGQKTTSENPVRSLPVWPYIVFFRVIEAHRVVRILLVRHGARRRPKRFER